MAMSLRRAPPAPAVGDPASRPVEPPSPRLAFLLLLLCAALINSDQSLLAPNMSAAAEEFGMTAQEKDEKLGGTLAAGLFLAGAPAALAVGAAADGAMRRVDLLTLVLLLGSLGCLGSALAASFWQLFAARALTGVSLGGGLPITFSLMGDMFDQSERAVRSARLGVAMGVGQMLGQALAGAIGPGMGWRAPFVVVGALLLLLTGSLPRLMHEPARDGAALRGNAEESESFLLERCCGTPPAELARGDAAPTAAAPRAAAERRASRGWLAVFRVPTVWLLLLQGIPGCVPWGVISAYLPDFLHANQGLSVHQATLVMSCFSLGGIGGQLSGGQAGQALYNLSPRWPAALMLVAGSLGVVPMFLLITSRGWRVGASAACSALGGFFATQTGPNVRSTLINVTQSQQRGLAFACFALADDLGKGAGPVLIAAMVKALGRERAFALSMLAWLPCAALCGATALTVEADEARARAGAKRALGGGTASRGGTALV